ncbi:MAG: DeoR family transcriptional regulator [Bacteroidales bacterium]|nr:DeoR family transcriptional regulator [Bacteroidales bacterium]
MGVVNNVNKSQANTDATDNNLQKSTDVLENVPENIPAEIIAELFERQLHVIGRLLETGERNVLENVLETSGTLAAFFNVNERTIRRDLNVLQSKGIIRHVGPDKCGHWEVIENK